MLLDETKGQEQDPSSTSDEKQISSDEEKSNASEGEKTQMNPKEATVPLSRFKEVYRKNKTFESELNELRSTVESLKQEKDKEFNPQTWDEVVEHTKKRILKEINPQKTNEADKYIEQELDELRDLGEEFDEDSFLQYMVENELTDIPKAYIKFQKQEVQQAYEKGKQTADRKKKSSVGTSTKSSDGATDTPRSWKEIHNKSLDDIVTEELEKAGLIH